MKIFIKIIQGVLIGAGGVLPGVSGGVLAVLFGVYKPLMRLLAHPLKELKNTITELWPILVGFVIGYIGIAKVLAEALTAYETESLVVFVGMAIGIMPSLFREAGEKGRNANSWISLGVVFAVAFGILFACNKMELLIQPSFLWNMFGGGCLALSIIAPGMSASVLMLPLWMQGAEVGTRINFYKHITGAIGDLNISILLPIALGAVIAFVLLTRLVDWLMTKHYSVMFHGVIGLVVAATIFTFPVEVFAMGATDVAIHVLLLIAGVISTLLLDEFNKGVEKPPVE